MERRLIDKRLYALGGILFAALILLAGRVFYITHVLGVGYAREASAQRVRSVPLSEARGVIYDRNLLALTNGQSQVYAVIVRSECENIEVVERLLGLPLGQEEVQLFPLDYGVDYEELLRTKGVKMASVSNRYNGSGLLSHVIGYAPAEGVGFGIERSFDQYLRRDLRSAVAVMTDARAEAISGFGVKVLNAAEMSGVQITIDYHVQEICERALDTGLKSGAAIVVDVASGDILALASRPGFTQDDIAEHIGGKNAELVNRALCNYDVGSVFKILVAAAALEDGKVTPATSFDCGGFTEIAGRKFACNRLDGHGSLSFSDGFAYSCNIPFYSVGQRLGMERIRGLAEKFGFGQRVLNFDMGEQEGNLPPIKGALPGDVANVSIGQGSLQATPLQIADMVCTIANGGVRKQLNLVRGYVSEDGVTITAFGAGRANRRVVSLRTAQEIRNMMRGVVEYGSGTTAMPQNTTAGGKTASAETGWVVEGEVFTHGWFAGFFPADQPKYVCVVLAENGKRGSASAAPVFKEIAEKITEMY